MMSKLTYDTTLFFFINIERVNKQKPKDLRFASSLPGQSLKMTLYIKDPFEIETTLIRRCGLDSNWKRCKRWFKDAGTEVVVETLNVIALVCSHQARPCQGSTRKS